LLGSAGGGGRSMDRGGDFGQGEPMREPMDVPEDDIPF
jgi:hypothetical protein